MSRLKQFSSHVNYNSQPLGKKSKYYISGNTWKIPKTRNFGANTAVEMKCLPTRIEKKTKCVVLGPATRAVFILAAG